MFFRFSYSVPDLQLDLLPLDVDHPGAELHPDGQVVHRLEALVRELQEEAGLANAWNEDDIESRAIRTGCGAKRRLIMFF